MTAILKRLGLLATGAIAFAAGLMWNGETSPSTMADLYSAAEARVGRPMTPVSYAGVARRTTRRTVAATSAVYAAPVYAAPVYAAPVYAPACATVIDSYGRSYQRC
jgi:hypothetical protein